MSDYQQIVDEIRFALQSEDCEFTEELRVAAGEYALACHEVNLRLRKIETYLDGGLRSEAIQLAEGPPSVEEIVGLLNFPEMEAWEDVVAIYDLPRSEALNLQVVGKLNEAQLIELPLQNLLSRHRLLALHRAPLKLRLNVLRQLRNADPETTSWEDDVRTFEKARFQEMAEEIRTAQRQGDLPQLKLLQKDLADGNWLEIPPARLIHSIKNSAAELTKQVAFRQLEELAQQLENAFSELDFPKARELSVQWKDALRRAGPAFPTAPQEQVAPVLGWVQDEEEREAAERKFQQLTATLERELDQATSTEELDRLVHEIQRLDRDVPELLALRYQNRREALQISQTRLHRLQLGSALAVVIAVAVGIGFLVRHQLQASEADRVASHVEQLLENHQVDEAKSVLSKRNDIARWDRLSALQTRIDKELKDEQERQVLYQNSLALAREAKTHEQIMNALQQARTHARTPEEKRTLTEIERNHQTRHDEEMMTRESELGESIRVTGEQLAKLDREMGTGTGDQKTGEAVVGLAEVIGELQKKSVGLRPEFAAQVRLLSARRKELEDLRNQRLLQQQRLADLTLQAQISSALGNPAEAVDRYRDSLLAFADSIPQEKAAAMYRERTKEDMYWKAALTWAGHVNTWQDTWPRDLTEMSKRISTCRTFITSHSGAPDTALAKRYADQLEALTSITGHIDGSGTGLQTRMERIFSSPLVEKSACVKIRDGRIFYVPEGTRIQTNGIPNFRFYVGYGNEDLDTQKKIPTEDFVSHTPAPSPSQVIATFVKARVFSTPPEQWNVFCQELSLKILDDAELNPFLKLDLLKRCLEVSASGDLFLKDQLEPHLKHLQGAAINPLARWMNPDDVEGKRSTEDAKQILTHFQRLKSLDDVWRDADKQRAEFSRALQRSVSIVGWLQPGQQWTCHMKDCEQAPDGDLLVIFVPDGSKESEWRTIGRVANGTMQFKHGTNEFLAAGRPVFADQRSGALPGTGPSSTTSGGILSGATR
ncbi:hypothetical protein SH661x_001457 [Planctomicrobium sp. SH661]|uniref:hypothetical protein n=1 Tax=Planctomicrobium sp. SH661 TaxID=3448124 RepID=UPI003F5C8C6A